MTWLQVLAFLSTKPEPEESFELLVKQGRVKNPKTCREQLRNRGYKV